jgi:hypothetical protein
LPILVFELMVVTVLVYRDDQQELVNCDRASG